MSAVPGEVVAFCAWGRSWHLAQHLDGRQQAGNLTVTLMAQLVDFIATPIVVVDLDYLDEVNNVHQVGAVTFTAVNSQTWVIPVKDLNRKHFSYTLTYYTADGQEHRQPTQVQPMPRVIIPRYQQTP